MFLDTALVGGFTTTAWTEFARCTPTAACIGRENKLHDLRNVLADGKNYTGLCCRRRRRLPSSVGLPLQSARRHSNDM
ncbi:hypothetical protein E2562_036201 [Oryza meyeriana var. granulata]|uniref:Uncharacterized protein n=1 Tax=Oryza meyeriana var. granulata TaxID=110450 RepID=A0A6G1ET23_9ORYZ|nr:hypothetical protein E2562_036201 [Oryza meyeriana var. granulata]